MAAQARWLDEKCDGSASAGTATWVSVECLRCGHRGLLRETDLPRFGEKPDAPIAAFIKRLKCRQCGSQSVRAFRTNAGSSETE